MTSTTTAQTPVQILEVTRRIFAASHWVNGTLSSLREVAVEFDEDGFATAFETKPRMCSVGAMRYAALAPMENALDGAWMTSHLGLAGIGVVPESDEDEAAHTYLTALEVLLLVANETSYEDYDRDLDTYRDEEQMDMPLYERIVLIEDKVIDWNDSFNHYTTEEERKTLVETEILPVFDSAIKALKEGK